LPYRTRFKVSLREAAAVPGPFRFEARGGVDARAVLGLVLKEDGVALAVVLRFEQPLKRASIRSRRIRDARWSCRPPRPNTETTPLRA
jgi:hypothetical protein